MPPHHAQWKHDGHGHGLRDDRQPGDGSGDHELRTPARCGRPRCQHDRDDLQRSDRDLGFSLVAGYTLRDGRRSGSLSLKNITTDVVDRLFDKLLIVHEPVRAIKRGQFESAPMGYLICGPVGTGKSFIAECYAGSVGIPCAVLKNFRSKYVGETEEIGRAHV